MNRKGHYDGDLEPYVVPMPEIGGAYPQIFQVTDLLPFPSTEQLIRAVGAGCQIDLGVPNESGMKFDLSTVQAAIPRIVELRISCSKSVIGWDQLARATSLTSFLVVDDEPPEVLHLADLPRLSNAGVVGVNCLSVCDNPNLRSVALRLPRSRATPTIQAPIESMSLTSKMSHVVLDRMIHTESLRELLVEGAEKFDCRSLLRFRNLRSLEFQSCVGLRNVAVMSELPELRVLDIFRCREIDDTDAMARLLETTLRVVS